MEWGIMFIMTGEVKMDSIFLQGQEVEVP
jgi:hypothetical protein